MKYLVTVAEKIGTPHIEVGTFEANSGHEAIKQAEKEYKPKFKTSCWFATPCPESNEPFYHWGRG